MLLWAALTASLFVYILGFGHNQPWADELEFVPALTGNEPVGPFFLQPHNEHRLPLPRVIYIALWELTHDFRAGMVLQILMLSGMAYRGMRLAAILRGSPHWANAFFPLSLLHVGHCENLLMGYQLCFILAAALVWGVLELALRSTPENAGRTALLAALAALALSLTGGFGIVLAAPVVLWVGLLMASALRPWKLVATGLLLITIAYCGFYFSTYERPPAHPPFELKNWAASLQASGQFLAISSGIGVGPGWFLALPLLIAALGWAALSRIHTTGDRLRSLGLAAVALGVILLSLAIGAGRGGFGRDDMGLWPRYSALAWPLLAAVYFAALLGAGPIRRWLPRAVCAASVLAFVPNTIHGLNYGLGHDAWLKGIARQLREDVAVEAIVESSLQGTGQEARALRGIPMLRAAKIGPFAGWNPP